MITYKLVFNSADSPSQNKNKFVAPNDPAFKPLVFERALSRNSLKIGDKVKIRGTNLRAEITDVIKDIDKVQWERNRPYFIWLSCNGEEMYAHPAQLKRMNK